MVKNSYCKTSVLEEAEQKEVIECPRCGFAMKHMQTCHMICSNCGMHLDCSDKGGVW